MQVIGMDVPARFLWNTRVADDVTFEDMRLDVEQNKNPGYDGESEDAPDSGTP